MSAQTPASHPVLRIATVQRLPDVLRELGQDPSQVIADLCLEPDLFSHPDNRITLGERGMLLDYCSKVSGCPHFGLLVGQTDGLDQLGLVGLLARHSPDVGTALRRLIRHFRLHAQGVEIGLAIGGGRALFSYEIDEKSVAGIDQTGDGAVAAQLNIMRELSGPDFKAIAAWFVRPPPNTLKPYRNFFQVRLRFDAPTCGLEFSSSWLERRLPLTDATLAQLIAEKVTELELQETEDFLKSVRHLMQTALAFGHVRARQIASMLGMHVRTYHRRLRLEGASHQELLDQTRMTLACRLLENSSKDIAEVSDLLGYAEPRSFIRAFRRWTTITPARWRRNRDI
jgi:AraC-like DNA-binding protein